MTPTELETFARASAQTMGLELDEAEIASVASQLAILLEHARNFGEFDLPADLDPLTAFDP